MIAATEQNSIKYTNKAFKIPSKLVSICLLMSLPRDIYDLICSEWLKLVEIARLDCALTHSSVRDEWLAQLGSKSMNETIVVDLSKDIHCHILKWIQLRNIPWFDLTLKDRRSYGMASFINLSSVKVLTLDGFTSSSVVNRCPNLTVLNLTQCNFSTFYDADPEILANLKGLKFNNDYHRKGMDFSCSIISKHVKQLDSIEAEFNEKADNASVIEFNQAIVTNNKHLTRIKLQGDVKLLEDALDCCPLLTSVEYQFLSLLSLEPPLLTLQTMLRLKQISELSLNYRGGNFMQSNQYLEALNHYQQPFDFGFLVNLTNTLTFIRLHDCLAKDESWIYEIIKTCSHCLRKIHLIVVPLLAVVLLLETVSGDPRSILTWIICLPLFLLT